MNFKKDELYFIPLGGAEQFGVNLNIYGYQGKWLAIDCGLGFADERFPGIDILIPDPAFIEARMKDLGELLLSSGGFSEIVMGNTALVRAMVETGVRVATSYPGSPTPEIAAAIQAMPRERRPFYFEFSTNEKVAVEVALGAGSDAAYLVDYAEDIDPTWLDGVITVGVTSGASVPEVLVRGVLERLAECGFVTVQSVTTANETLVFALPREIRPARR